MKRFQALIIAICSLLWPVATQAVPTPQMVLQSGHSNQIRSIRFSPNGRLAASVDGDELKLWNAVSGELIRTWDAHLYGACDAVFSPDGRTLVVASVEKGLSLWDVQSGQSRGSFSSPEACGSVCFSPDGKWVIAASGHSHLLSGKIFIWNWQSHRLIRSLRGEPSPFVNNLGQSVIHNMGVTSDSQTIWLRATDQLMNWQLSSGKKGRSVKFEEDTLVVPSPDGKSLAVAPGWPLTIQMLDASGKRKIWEYKFEDQDFFLPQGITFSPDGRFLLVTLSQGNTFIVLDRKTGKIVKQWRGSQDLHNEPALLAFSPDGQRLGIGRRDAGYVQFTTWPQLRGLTSPAEPRNSIIDSGASRDGSILAWLQNDDAVAVWDVKRGRQIKMLSLNKPTGPGYFHFGELELSPDGKTVYVQAREELRAIDIATGKELWHRFNYATMQARPGSEEENSPPDFASLSLSGDGKVLASIYNEGPLRCWEASTGRWLLPAPGKGEPLYTFDQTIRVSPDGKWVGIGSSEDFSRPSTKPQPLQIIDVATQRNVRSLDGVSARPIAFSFDGKSLLVMDESAHLFAYDTLTLKKRWQTPGPASGTLLNNGNVLCLELDGALRERSIRNGRILKTWPQSRQMGRMFGFSFRRLGTDRITALTSEETLSIWDVNTQRKLVTLAIPALPDRTSPHWLIHTPGGFYTGSHGVEKFLRWRTGIRLESGVKWQSKFRSPAKVAAALALRK
jgi:WD40 repeat protein